MTAPTRYVFLKPSSSRRAAKEAVKDSNIKVIIALNGSYYFEQWADALFIDDDDISDIMGIVIIKETDEAPLSMRVMTNEDYEQLCNEV